MIGWPIIFVVGFMLSKHDGRWQQDGDGGSAWSWVSGSSLSFRRGGVVMKDCNEWSVVWKRSCNRVGSSNALDGMPLHGHCSFGAQSSPVSLILSVKRSVWIFFSPGSRPCFRKNIDKNKLLGSTNIFLLRNKKVSAQIEIWNTDAFRNRAFFYATQRTPDLRQWIKQPCHA